MKSSLLALLGLVVLRVASQAQSPLGPETQVNPDHADYQLAPQVALAGDGAAVVIYDQSHPLRDELRLLDEAGTAFGATQRMTPPSIGSGGYGSSLVMTRSGKGIDCWSDGSHSYCRSVDSRIGIIGPAVAVEDEERGNFDPWVAFRGESGIVVSWIRLIDDQVRVFVRFLTVEGVPESESILLSTFPLNYELRTAVAALGPDEAIVVWNEPGADGNDEGIVGQRVRRTGPVGPRFPVNSYTAGIQKLPVISSDGQSRFVVAWMSEGQDASLTGIYAQRFDAEGTKLGPELQVSSDANSDQVRPSVSMDSLGNFVIAFYSTFESEDLAEDSFIRAYGSDGAPLGPQVLVNEQIIYEQEYPTVALSDAGLIQVAYQSWRQDPDDSESAYNYDVMTRRFVLPCIAGGETLCLENGRFQVRAFWKNYAGHEGAGQAIPLSDESGGFWFFGPGLLELLVKVVDGCDDNQRFWFYAAGLTDVDVDLLVTDTWTGKVAMFTNPLATPFLPVQTIDRFDTCAGAAPQSAQVSGGASLAEGREARVPLLFETTSCAPDATTHCLVGGRFRVRAHWTSFSGAEGDASALPFGDDSGLFWFFSPGNVELVVKVVDACLEYDRFWVYASGLTNVAVSLDVEDTVTGEHWRRETALGEPFPPRFDSDAFATCQ